MIRNSAFALLITLSTSLYAAQPGDTSPDLAKAKSTAESVCVACHSADGNSTIPANPILAGQHREYLLKQLTEFKSVDGKPQVRNNAVMLGMTATLSGDDMRGLASYFSLQKVKPAKATDPKLVAAGKILWRRGDPDKGIPACAGCHGPAGAGPAGAVSAPCGTTRGIYGNTTQELSQRRTLQRSGEDDADHRRQTLRQTDQGTGRLHRRLAWIEDVTDLKGSAP